ncbi:putative Thyrotropin-releasing hormone receptor [Hypsibius exemplaris]|uniref:Thyrotropin-releasing hormone receptor n=1 Tax=Hypsibius exemplaris TaxID=2072580 RepID=A0A1W0WR69_HYPEX|nr:putative Thyrotropin-releasing hormone receptor [Hypsibius exemplaris]
MAESNNTTNYWGGDGMEGNGTNEDFEVVYRIVATVLHIVIFITGLIGNVGLIFVVSISSADLIVLSTAVPEAIAFKYIGERWLLGEAGCAIFVFSNFFGINAGSLSLLAFTVERYIAGCRPLQAQKLCTLHRSRKVIMLCWLLAFAYCAPWFGLTEVRRDSNNLGMEQCELRLTLESYAGIFGTDLVLFYLIPLVVAVVAYAKIARVLRERVRRFSTRKRHSSGYGVHVYLDNGGTWITENRPSHANGTWDGQPPLQQQQFQEYDSITQSSGFCHDHGSHRAEQSQGLRMMVVIVVMFAVSWLPFRGLLLYNTFASEPWLDMWFLLFAKTLIYLNCAINPFLYNILCRRFRVAVWEIVLRKSDKMRWLISCCPPTAIAL